MSEFENMNPTYEVAGTKITRGQVLAALVVLYILVNSRGRIIKLEKAQKELIEAVRLHNTVLEYMGKNKSVMDHYFGPRAA